MKKKTCQTCRWLTLNIPAGDLRPLFWPNRAKQDNLHIPHSSIWKRPPHSSFYSPWIDTFRPRPFRLAERAVTFDLRILSVLLHWSSLLSGKWIFDMILEFRFPGISRNSIIKQICNVIINMTATRQLVIILAFVALWEIKFEQMATVTAKSSRLWILFIFSSDFEMFLVSLFSSIAKSIQYFYCCFYFILFWLRSTNGLIRAI